MSTGTPNVDVIQQQDLPHWVVGIFSYSSSVGLTSSRFMNLEKDILGRLTMRRPGRASVLPLSLVLSIPAFDSPSPSHQLRT